MAVTADTILEVEDLHKTFRIGFFRKQVLARAKALKAGRPEAAPPPCCDSPLVSQARAQRWKYCPACGTALD